jgi:hypothetical protein
MESSMKRIHMLDQGGNGTLCIEDDVTRNDEATVSIVDDVGTELQASLDKRQVLAWCI